MDDFVAAAETLLNVSREDLLHDIEYSLRFRHAKPSNARRDVAFRTFASMVLDQLELSGYVFKRRPSAKALEKIEG